MTKKTEGNGNKEQSNQEVRDHEDIALSHLSVRLTISAICRAFPYIFCHPF